MHISYVYNLATFTKKEVVKIIFPKKEKVLGDCGIDRFVD
jgi:preprotein translocase subunit SecE